MDSVDMRHEMDSKLKWALHVKNHWTKFSRLLALTRKEDIQVSNKIIFLVGLL